jgi:Domain of unknown function (DUF4142)
MSAGLVSLVFSNWVWRDACVSSPFTRLTQSDRLYIEGQIADRQKTVQLFEYEIGSGQDAKLKAFASYSLWPAGWALSDPQRGGGL